MQNLGRDYDRVVRRLDELGILINGSFVFGLVATPYPGTALFERMEASGRILMRDWDRYDTRQVVFEPQGMTRAELQNGYSRVSRVLFALQHIACGLCAHFAFTLGQALRVLARLETLRADLGLGNLRPRAHPHATLTRGGACDSGPCRRARDHGGD